MNKKECLAFLGKLELHGYVFGLERIEKFLFLLGNPEKKFKTIHVAGTNGKGSTCAFIASILQKAGYKTGLYTSPHLIEFNERIQINGKKIPGKELIQLVSKLKKLKEKNQSKKKFSGLKNLTYFEFTTAIAFEYFAQKKVDFLVCETGMGGRLDATNVVLPLVSVITNVSMEHEKYLGNYIEKIALEKAGIIKKNIPLITAEKSHSVLKIFEKICMAKGAPFYVSGKDFPFRKIKTSLRGKFQQENANLAFAVIEILKKFYAVEIQDSAVKKGFLSAKWPGRFQIVQKNHFVVLDCAHNVACMEALKESFLDFFGKKKAILVIGISSDKNVSKMVEIISPIAKKVFCTRAKLRGIETGLLKKEFEKKGFVEEQIFEIPEVSVALKTAISSASKSDIVLVCGSCFVVGEAMNALKLKI